VTLLVAETLLLVADLRVGWPGAFLARTARPVDYCKRDQLFASLRDPEILGALIVAAEPNENEMRKSAIARARDFARKFALDSV
jgi:hypothetical protein